MTLFWNQQDGNIKNSEKTAFKNPTNKTQTMQSLLLS